MNLNSKIEAILFYKAEPVSKKELAGLLNTSLEEIESAKVELKNNLNNRGIALMEKGDDLMLGTNPEVSSLIEQLVKEELSKDLGKAGLETLSIILYKGPVSRSEIDYIRGVNSTFIIRNLLVRGLIEKDQNPRDSRSYIYSPSFELLSFLGISSIEDLPNREAVLQKIASFTAENDNEDKIDDKPENDNQN